MENKLDFVSQDNITELLELLRVSKDRGGFFLMGVSGPLARKAVEDQLLKQLEGEFTFKKVRWNPGIKDLSQLFPLDDPTDTLYIVDDLEKSLSEDDGAAAYALLNMTREYYSRNKKTVIYRAPPEVIYKGIQWKAADFWSFRLGSFDFFLIEDYRARVKEKVSGDLEGYETDAERIALYERLLAQEKKQKKPDKMRIAAILSELGYLYHIYGQLDKSLSYHKKALELDRMLHARTEEAISLGNIGTVYYSLGQFDEALKYFEESIALSRQLGDTYEEARNLGHTGTVYLDLEQPKKALTHLNQALEIFSQLGEEQVVSSLKGNIGNAYFALGNTKEAFLNFHKSYEIARHIQDKWLENQQIFNIGTVYGRKGEFKKALKHFEEALALAEGLKNMPMRGNALENIGKVYLGLERPEKALTYFQKALEIFKEMSNKKKEKEVIQTIEQIKQSRATQNIPKK